MIGLQYNDDSFLRFYALYEFVNNGELTAFKYSRYIIDDHSLFSQKGQIWIRKDYSELGPTCPKKFQFLPALIFTQCMRNRNSTCIGVEYLGISIMHFNVNGLIC